MRLIKEIAMLLAIFSAGAVIGAILDSFGVYGYYLMTVENAHWRLSELVGLAELLGFFAIPLACIFGIPLFFLLRYTNTLNWWSVTGLGAFMGSLVGTMQFVSGFSWIECVGLGTFSANAAWRFMVLSNLPLNMDAPKSSAPVS